MKVSERELHLYVDGHLEPERRWAIEVYLEGRPEEAERVRVYRRQNELLRDLFADTEEVPVSPLVDGLRRAIAQRLRRIRWWPPATAAALLLAAALGGGGVELYRAPPSASVEPLRRFAESAVRAHSFYAPAAAEQTEFGADGAAKLNTLLDKRLGAPLHLPDLSHDGLSLVSGRLLPSATGPAVQLVYRDKGGQLVTLFLGAVDEATPHAAHNEPPPRLYAAHDGDIGIAVVGSLGGDELRGIAEAAQRSLGAPQPAAQPAQAPAPSGDHHAAGPSRT
jgi:anti-sigma factor RsiW